MAVALQLYWNCSLQLQHWSFLCLCPCEHGCSLAQVAYLGMEHTDTGPRQRHHNNRGYSQYERPVKIYN